MGHTYGETPALPDIGSVVEVRGATWAVTDVTEQRISRSPADEYVQGTQHVVSLQSIEEDRMGEELSVVWELEVGQTVLPDQGLPNLIDVNSFDDPNRLGAFIDAMRWGAVTNADAKRFQAPFRTGANFEPYQLEPLRRALSSPRANMLLADDVGLGKTIEAGLVVEELLLRHRARTVIIVCPPSLCIKWRNEMLEKFGLDFTIVNAETVAYSRRRYGLGSNPLRLYPRVIMSMAWISSITAQRMLNEVYAQADSGSVANRYTFDILVVDEAHHVAPAAPASSRMRGYAVDSNRTRSVRRLAEHCEHRLFLSATPHNGYTESFTALLEMIDARRFARGASIDEKALSEVAVRRLKTSITSLNFKERHIESLTFTPSEDEVKNYALLDTIFNRTQRERGASYGALGITALLLRKRLLSSPWAFGRTLSRYMDANLGEDAYQEDDGYYAEVMGSGQSDEEEGGETQPEFVALTHSSHDNPLAAATAQEIATLNDWAATYEGKPNARLAKLIEWLDSICRPEGKRQWNNERVVIFTEHADTLELIRDILESRGYTKERLATISGSTSAQDRERIRAQFNADPAEQPLRVLLATDAAGEGIDLQSYCYRLVNFDIPFNPSRLEQRVGRIDRYGQQHTPEIFYFTTNSASSLGGDSDFMERIAHKIAIEQQDLKTVNPLIDAQIYRRFCASDAATAQVLRAGDDKVAQEINRVLARGMELNRSLTALERDYDASRADMHLSERAERRVVDEALELTNQPPLIPTNRTGIYELPSLNPGWRPIADALRPLLDPSHVRHITFDDSIAKANPGVAYMHLGSTLMDKAARTLRSNLYGQESKLHRVTAVVVPELEYTCAAAVARLVLVGRSGLRVHEEMFVTGIRFGAQNMAEEKVMELLDDALDAERPLQLADEDILKHLEAAWDERNGHMKQRLEDAVMRRAEIRQQAVETSLHRREEDDKQRVHGIFSQFRTNLQASLQRLKEEEAYEQEQLALWADEEQRQRARDIANMTERLSALDDEERKEVELVDLRYRDIRPYVSIAALVFAVNEHDAQQWRQ